MNDHPNSSRGSGNAPLALVCAFVAVGMIGLSYASVPLYRLFCQVTGYGGTTQRAERAPGQVIDREMSVEFDANTSPGLPWTFKPSQRRVKVKLGEQAMAFYHAVNNSGRELKGQAAFNVTPDEAGKYFTKIQCFCFTEQTLSPHQSIEMPVIFFVDPQIDKDVNLKQLKTITLSYTFFPAAAEKVSGTPAVAPAGLN